MRVRGILLCGAFGFMAAAPVEAQPQAAGSEEAAKDQVFKDIAYYPEAVRNKDAYLAERCRLDLYVPAGRKDFATVVWFHGGGLKQGGKSIPKALKNQGLGIVAVNYRLSPKAKCPAYLEDAAAAVAWTLKNIHQQGGDPKKVFVAGHSAGGYLVSLITLDPSYLKVHQLDANQIAGVFSYSGQCLTHFTIREERGDRERALADRFAPIHHVRADAPLIVLYTGQRDLEMAGRYEENALLFSLLKAVGDKDVELHELKGGNHNSMVEPAHQLMLARLKKILEPS